MTDLEIEKMQKEIQAERDFELVTFKRLLKEQQQIQIDSLEGIETLTDLIGRMEARNNSNNQGAQ